MAEEVLSRDVEEAKAALRQRRNGNVTSSRNAILGRIGVALSNNGGSERVEPPAVNEDVVRQVHGDHPDSLVARFRQRLEALGDRLVQVANPDDAREWLIKEIEGRSITRVVIDEDARQLLHLDEHPNPGEAWSSSGRREEALRAQAGITTARWGIAETGSIVLVTAPDQSRLTSLAPNLHIALLEKTALFPDIVDAIAHQGDEVGRATVTWITGSSRTGDIEGINIRGVHGPGELTVVLLDRGD
jgi:L-lactate dehydrogenase complex protein LldG